LNLKFYLNVYCCISILFTILDQISS
jgi:hypothetical protein